MQITRTTIDTSHLEIVTGDKLSELIIGLQELERLALPDRPFELRRIDRGWKIESIIRQEETVRNLPSTMSGK